jgi:RNase H-like domain found in reverse transcriptase
VIKAALDGFIATLASRNFKTRLIMTDGEGRVGKLKTALNLAGTEVDTSGGHMPTIERQIQVIKQRVRAYITHRLSYTLNAIGISMCVLFCVSRMNYEIPGNGPSPREVLTENFRCSFGDFALPTVPATDNSLSASVEQLITLVSKSLTQTQLAWSTIQKEAYAIFFCCTHLDNLLRDRKFTILPDHKNLTFIK